MEAIARARYARYSPRKVGQVLDLVRGKSVEKAFHILPTVSRSAAHLVFKTLKSAYANLGEGTPNAVFITKAWVDSGPVYKRIRPMAMGGRGIYKRKTCHLNIVVGDQRPAKKT